jgi:hypothetical protein
MSYTTHSSVSAFWHLRLLRRALALLNKTCIAHACLIMDTVGNICSRKLHAGQL